jgi:hypothetical protein
MAIGIKELNASAALGGHAIRVPDLPYAHGLVLDFVFINHLTEFPSKRKVVWPFLQASNRQRCMTWYAPDWFCNQAVPE